MIDRTDDPDITIAANFIKRYPSLVNQTLSEFQASVDVAKQAFYNLPAVARNNAPLGATTKCKHVAFNYAIAGRGLSYTSRLVMTERKFAKWLYDLAMLVVSRKEFDERQRREMEQVSGLGPRAEMAAEHHEERKDWDVLDKKILAHLLTVGPTKPGQDFATVEQILRAREDGRWIC